MKYSSLLQGITYHIYNMYVGPSIIFSTLLPTREVSFQLCKRKYQHIQSNTQIYQLIVLIFVSYIYSYTDACVCLFYNRMWSNNAQWVAIAKHQLILQQYCVWKGSNEELLWVALYKVLTYASVRIGRPFYLWKRTIYGALSVHKPGPLE